LSESALHALADLCKAAALGRPASTPVTPAQLEQLLTAAAQHDVAGLLAGALLTLSPDTMSADDLEGLSIYCDGLRLAAARAEAQLVEILLLLAARGLPAMPFKGPLLARSFYVEPWLRPCLDLDLMVHQDDAPYVRACLIEAGFQHRHGLDPAAIAALQRYDGEYILFRPGALPVEPHWRPAPWTMAFDIDIEALWQRVQPTTFLGADCYRPSAADHLFLLALHGAKERWHSLKWLVDVAALLASQPQLDLPELRASAASQGCRRMLDLALLLSHRLFAIPATVPPSDAATTRLTDQVLRRLHCTVEPPPGPAVLSAFHWRIRERRRERLNYVARTLFTPRVAHYQRLPLPAPLRWLHVPLKLPWDYVVTPVVGLGRRLAVRAR
jgi:hypothetical protein